MYCMTKKKNLLQGRPTAQHEAQVRFDLIDDEDGFSGFWDERRGKPERGERRGEGDDGPTRCRHSDRLNSDISLAWKTWGRFHEVAIKTSQI